MTAAVPANLTAALVALTADLPPIHKGKTATVNPKEGRSYTYKFADLADVAAAITPRLAAVGLVFTCKPTTLDNGAFVLKYALRHVSGEEEPGIYPLPHPDRTKPQDLGSAITYARRYTLCCVTGVVPDEDDDAQAAQSGPAATSSQPPPPPAELAQDAANRLARYEGPVGTLDNVLRYALDNGYADERVTVPWDEINRPTLTEAIHARAAQLIEAQERATAEREQAAAEGSQAPADPAPPAGEAPVSQPPEVPPASQAPDGPTAPQNGAEGSSLAHLAAIVEQAAEATAADAVRLLYRSAPRPVRDLDVTELLEPASDDYAGDVAVLGLTPPVELGALLVAIGKRLDAGDGPLATPASTGDAWAEQDATAPPP